MGERAERKKKKNTSLLASSLHPCYLPALPAHPVASWPSLTLLKPSELWLQVEELFSAWIPSWDEQGRQNSRKQRHIIQPKEGKQQNTHLDIRTFVRAESWVPWPSITEAELGNQWVSSRPCVTYWHMPNPTPDPLLLGLWE